MSFNPKTVQNLQYFVGKVCSVFTPPINRSFDEIRSREHFVIKVEDITNDGIWGKHPYRETFSFFPMNYVALIQEEQVLDPSNPEHKAALDEFEKTTGKKIISDVSPHLTPKTNTVVKQEAPVQKTGAFMDINQLTALAKDTRRSYALHDLYDPLKKTPNA